MSDIPSSNFSESAAANNATAPNGAPEGMAPSGVNDTIREVMAAIKREWNRNNPTVTSGGSANAQTLTYATAPTAYVQGMRFCFIAGFSNTGATTLNVNGLGAKSVFMDGAALGGGEIVAASIVEVVYDGTRFHMISSRPVSDFPAGSKNALMNGSFEIWQRGAGGSASIAASASSSVYTADRWVISTGANEASTVSQVAGLTVQSQWAAKVQKNSGQTGTGAILFEHPFTLDEIVALRGQVVTLSATIKAGANFSSSTSQISIQLLCGTGTTQKRGAGSFAGETAPIGAAQSITTTAARYSWTSAAIPTNATQMCVLFFYFPVGTAGADDSYTIDDVQLEIGAATAFDSARWDFTRELVMCQRFYRKSFPYATAPAQNAGIVGAMNVQTQTGATGTFGAQVQFGASMRIAPSLTTYNPSAANANWRDTTNSADRTVAVGTVSESGFPITGASAVAAANHAIHWQADAEL
jgi:hypothetical protein